MSRRSSKVPKPGDLSIVQASKFMWVYDKATGEMLSEMALPANATGAPMTLHSRRKAIHSFSCRRWSDSSRNDRHFSPTKAESLPVAIF
jgi:hypothetical protein